MKIKSTSRRNGIKDNKNSLRFCPKASTRQLS
jgi:hypothetical protein